MLAFGPVPSRRLGLSLGINHIPPKHCPYSCVYCQVGKTDHLEITRREFFPVEQILRDVKQKIDDSAKGDQSIDYLTLVPDGEPTLDLHLDTLIDELKQFGIPIAVISNASLIDREDVQQALLLADWVSLKVDSVVEEEWRKINRPHRYLSLSAILAGIFRFKVKYQGELVTETMLVSGVNDSDDSLRRLCDFLEVLEPFQSYLSVPVRPPAESCVPPPLADRLRRINHFVADRIPVVEPLFELERPEFFSTGDLDEDILAICAVHPIRQKALMQMINQAGGDSSAADKLFQSGKLMRVRYRGDIFYRRRW